MIVKLLTEHHLGFLSLIGGCRGSSESTHVKMSHCWKSHALARRVRWILLRRERYECDITHDNISSGEFHLIIATIKATPIWASTRENLSSGCCEQQRRRPACAYAQSDQRLWKVSYPSLLQAKFQLSG